MQLDNSEEILKLLLVLGTTKDQPKSHGFPTVMHFTMEGQFNLEPPTPCRLVGVSTGQLSLSKLQDSLRNHASRHS